MAPIRLAAPAVLLLLSTTAGAAIFDRAGRKLPDDRVNAPQVDWDLVPIGDTGTASGVGRVISPRFSCTGAFIDTGGDPDAPAYVLTAGHCSAPELPSSDAVEVECPAAPEMYFALDAFYDARPPARRFRIGRVAYSTMKRVDLALLELEASRRELLRDGFVPLRVRARPAEAGEPVENLGIPVAGVDSALRYLHRARCTIGEAVALREDVYAWEGARRNRCSIVGGDSGSPLISRVDGCIVGIQGTTDSDGAQDMSACALDRPCEIDAEGMSAVHPGENYAHGVAAVPSCFGVDGRFDPGRKGCALEVR